MPALAADASPRWQLMRKAPAAGSPRAGAFPRASASRLWRIVEAVDGSNGTGRRDAFGTTYHWSWGGSAMAASRNCGPRKNRRTERV